MDAQNRDSLVLKYVQSAIFIPRETFESEGHYLAFNRLVEREEARFSWLQLEKKPIKSNHGFGEVVERIGRSVDHAFLRESQKRTGSEIRAAANEAMKLAERLAFLIEQNSTLQFSYQSSLPAHDNAALDRVLNGLVFGLEQLAFSPEVEKELDQLQARDHPEYLEITTSEAYRTIRYGNVGFENVLRNFSRLARETETYTPVVPHPNRQRADQHAFALSVCSALNNYYGSPCIEIVAGFASAVFDTEVDFETIKKWWQRKGDNF